ncbi:ImmA/IrrE family metallo-endopeptidase [Terrabacter sp. Root85]|uniref:ImmA/IrrE family metallo-endopeptidase n=1 Tax=Terrabacter sp. Root85 TaxID=1736603 RepID=UPI0009EA24C7|nr:ImmA/IrrE family metallo-endopeptidase [Terrabacter sp. Root85]
MTQLKFELDEPMFHAVDFGHFRAAHAADDADLSLVYERVNAVWEDWRPFLQDHPQPSISGSSALAPEILATVLRDRLGVGNGPIPNVNWVLSNLGIVLGKMPQTSENISAFSCWVFDQPLVLVKTEGGGRKRVRFDAAHELGHLLMHREFAPSKLAEKQANRFAGSLLIPAQALPATGIKPFAWQVVESISEAFGVTRLAALKRAEELRLISEPVYRAALIHASRLGWNKRDPEDEGLPESTPDTPGFSFRHHDSF